MDDKTFTEFGLKLSICPTQHRWPNPDVEFSTQGNTITAKGLHWSRSHDAANWMRDYAAKALADMAAINADKSLSQLGKTSKKKLLAAKPKLPSRSRRHSQRRKMPRSNSWRNGRESLRVISKARRHRMLRQCTQSCGTAVMSYKVPSGQYGSTSMRLIRRLLLRSSLHQQPSLA